MSTAGGADFDASTPLTLENENKLETIYGRQQLKLAANMCWKFINAVLSYVHMYLYIHTYRKRAYNYGFSTFVADQTADHTYDLTRSVAKSMQHYSPHCTSPLDVAPTTH
ncbi:unnamed protein product [Ceratitis capitata]|uniref:(Mediterranean fruit fly) hypothetical protein n=1 Tax=Ceratitis capitata TaxID=7213 RepID=A0A811UBT5_CERCA|nr:unnamed protein product [Ceratitis capitata]